MKPIAAASRALQATLLFAAAHSLWSTAVAETFTKHGHWLQVGPNPCAIVAADLNEDGLPEIVTADRGSMGDPREERPANDELSLLVAQPGLTYEAKPPLRAGFAPWCVVAVNIDALKAPDLVVGSFHDARNRDLTLFRNLGENGFEPSTYAVPDAGLRYESVLNDDEQPIYTTPGITAVAVRDINRDGFRDAAAAGWASGVIAVFPGHAETYFGAPKLVEARGGPRDVQLADFDGDDQLDMAATMYNSNEIALWKGDGAFGFTEVRRFASRAPLPHKLRVADMNGDGKADLIVAHCFTSDSVAIFFGDGGFSFSVSQEIEMSDKNDLRVVEDEVRDAIVDDFNGDGRQDLAASCFASERVCVFLNRSSSGQGAPLSWEQERYSYNDARPYALCSADFNGDGKRDIGVTLWQANSVAILLGR
ncbi:MAG: VCBS repeat-containing protein [Candidatus Hydrogenedentes bacterium]|nr:VCBS repeat-containing protein [Candidatus Hydrogenedentota bacterium]